MNECCEAMEQAIKEEYLYRPISFNKYDGALKVLTPSLEGKPITPRGRKHKPTIIFTYCPFCGINLIERAAE